MRLTIKEVQGILKILKEELVGIPFDIYLYGSRTNDLLKGGDIDLLLLVSEQELKQTEKKKHVYLTKIKQEIGDQKIDLTIATKETVLKDPFLTLIFPNAIKLI